MYRIIAIITMLIGYQSALHVAHASEPVPGPVATALQALFKKYYPKATFTNREANGIHIEYNVTRFNQPAQNPARKHENPVQKGPNKGGIMCSVYLESGKYFGQLALSPGGLGNYQSTVIQKDDYKQLLAAPYSRKRNAHLWFSLKYPKNTSEDFMKELQAVLSSFENEKP